MSLKLPQRWMSIDALKIPMNLDQPQVQSFKLCGSSKSMTPPPSTSMEIEQLLRSAEANQLSFEAAKNSMAPDTKLNLTYAPNGIDATKRSTTFADTFTNDNPK